MCNQWRLQELFLERLLRNLNYTKFNKEITWIYQYHPKKKKKTLRKYMKCMLPCCFPLTKRKVKKKKKG